MEIKHVEIPLDLRVGFPPGKASMWLVLLRSAKDNSQLGFRREIEFPNKYPLEHVL